MNRTKTISLESVNDFLNSGSLNISLDDIYDNISLYEYNSDDPDGSSTKRLTWEEWYLKKRLESLKNEKALREELHQKMLLNSKKYGHFTEDEKKEKLREWLLRKEAERKRVEAKLERLEEEARIKKEKKELEKKRAEQKYQEWLERVKEKERNEKVKRDLDERRERWRQEQEKKKRKDNLKHMMKEKKEIVRVRPLSERRGEAVINGRLCSFYDWSTSPNPSFVNKEAWKS